MRSCPTCGRPYPQRMLLRGGITVDLEMETVHRADGTEVHLTRREWELLFCLVDAEGRPVHREQIEQWMRMDQSALTIYVRYLRNKLGDEAIETVPTRGYRAAIVHD